MHYHLHLLVPDFLHHGPDAADRLPAAETLVARGRRKRVAAGPRETGFEAWLCERFGVPMQRDWPVAPYSLLADGGEPGGDFWLRADPVHLRLDRDRLVLADSTVFDISRAEAEALVETLNRHFAGELRFYPLQPDRWYVRPAHPPADSAAHFPELETTPLAAVRGSGITDHLPRGPAAARFQVLMNETQMLLHEHPVNLEREARGALPLNSVWFWGGGRLSMDTAAPARPFRLVVADDPLALGLARASRVPVRSLPETGAALFAEPASECVALVVLDKLRPAASYAEDREFSERRGALERDWLAPLLAALRSGRIGMLTLHLGGRDWLLEIEAARSDLRRFWRRRKPLSHYVDPA